MSEFMIKINAITERLRAIVGLIQALSNLIGSLIQMLQRCQEIAVVWHHYFNR